MKLFEQKKEKTDTRIVTAISGIITRHREIPADFILESS